MASTTHDHAHDDHHDHGDDYHPHAHISSVKTYLAVFGGLLFFTASTVAAYNVRLGDMNLIVAVIIATMKAALVCTWFMHLKYEQRFNTLFFLGSLLFVSVFLGYTLNDTDHRAEETIQGARRDPANGNYAYGTAQDISENGEFETVAETEESIEETPAPPAADTERGSDHADAEDGAVGEQPEAPDMVEGTPVVDEDRDGEDPAVTEGDGDGVNTEEDREGVEEEPAPAAAMAPTMAAVMAPAATAATMATAMTTAAVAPAATPEPAVMATMDTPAATMAPATMAAPAADME